MKLDKAMGSRSPCLAFAGRNSVVCRRQYRISRYELGHAVQCTVATCETACTTSLDERLGCSTARRSFSPIHQVAHVSAGLSAVQVR